MNARSARRTGPLAMILLVIFTWLLSSWLHWPPLAVIPLAAVAAIVAGVLILAARDTLAMPVPPELVMQALELKHQGWRTARIHPWWRDPDDEPRPHMHMITPDGIPARVVQTGTGYTVYIHTRKKART